MPTDDVAQRRYDFGRALFDRRHELGLTQEALAELIGFDRKSIGRLENGTHAVTIDRLWVITDALQISIGELEQRAAVIASARQQRQPPAGPDQ